MISRNAALLFCTEWTYATMQRARGAVYIPISGFAGNDETGYRYIIGATGTDDARALNACLKKYCGARGGGKPAMVQGSVQSTQEEIETALRKSLYEISES